MPKRKLPVGEGQIGNNSHGKNMSLRIFTIMFKENKIFFRKLLYLSPMLSVKGQCLTRRGGGEGRTQKCFLREGSTPSSEPLLFPFLTEKVTRNC